MIHLTGRTFSGIFQGEVEIKESSIPGNIVIISGPGSVCTDKDEPIDSCKFTAPCVLTVETQRIETGAFEGAGRLR